MTKKLFTIIAVIISNLNVDKETKNQIADAFAMELSKYNSRFNYDRFKAACINKEV